MTIRTFTRVLRARLGGGEDGIALILVLGTMLALSLVAVAGLAFVTNGLSASRHEQDYATDSAATQAAAQDFLHHLNLCDDYWAGSSSSCYSSANGGVANTAATAVYCFDASGNAYLDAACTKPVTVPAGRPGSWTSLPFVPGTNGVSNGQYAYQVVGIPYATGQAGAPPVVGGTIRLQVWGRSGTKNPVVRTQIVDFKREGLLQYIYYTDIEGTDPLVLMQSYQPFTGTTCSFTQINADGSTTAVNNVLNCSFSGLSLQSAQQACDQHYYSGPAAPGTTNPQGTPAPGRASNSTTDFYGTVTYQLRTGNSPNYVYTNKSATYAVRTGGATGSLPSCQINFGGGDKINGPLHTNDAMQIAGAITFGNPRTETSWGYSAAQSSPVGPPSATKLWIDNCSGCTPSGNLPTSNGLITLPPSNAAIEAQTQGANKGCEYTGPTQITLNSNGTMTVLSPDTTSASAPVSTSCYNSLPMTSAQTVNLPANGVVYVQSAAGTSACSTQSRPFVGAYPASNDIGSAGISCNQGDLYLSGTLKGQLTVGTDGNIDLVGNTVYNSGVNADGTLNGNGTDTLGLIANGFVQVYHPVSSTCTNSTSCEIAYSPVSNGFTIDAAILSVQHSFTVENYQYGASLSDGGTTKKLHVNGGIYQEYRGPVGQLGSGGATSTGFLKDYNFDTRLPYAPPPYFLDPASSPWQVFQTSEQ